MIRKIIRILAKPFQVLYNTLNLLRINLRHLAAFPRYRPPRNGRPSVLLALAEPGHPHYETCREGIEANGWNAILLPRAYHLRFVHQLLLYLALCPTVQVVQLIDVDLWNLFEEFNAVRRAMSFLAIRLIVAWPKLLGKRVIYSFGNVVPHEFDTPAERRRHKLICSLVDDVTSHAPAMTRDLLQIGIPAERIWPAEQADTAGYFRFPSEWKSIREQWNIPAEATVLLSIGSIRPYKGLEVLVEGFKRTRNPNLRLFIAGKPSAGYTAEEVARLAAGDERIILGPLRLLTNEEMGWIFAGSDFCVLPYRDIGHSGLVCQSLGLGVPVIASNVGCLPDYVCSGTGLLFEPGNPEDLARVLDHELERLDYQRARAEGLRLMRQRTPERIGQRLVRIYQYRRGGPPPETAWLF